MSDPVEVNVALAEALGIDLDHLIGFTVDVNKGRYPLVTVTRRLRDPIDPAVVEDTTTAFQLVPIDQAEAEPA